MRSELCNLSLFVSAIAKFLLMTGLGMGGAVALFAECCGFRVVALGFEKVSGPAQLACGLNFVPANNFEGATSPARKARRYA